MNKYLRHSLTLFTGESLAKVASVGTTIVLARWLSRGAAYDTVAAGMAALALLIQICDMGLVPYGLTESAKAPEDRSIAPATIFQVRFSNFLVIVLPLMAVTAVLPLPSEQKAMYLLFEAAAFVEALKPEWYLKGRQRFRLTAGVHLAATLLFLGGVWTAWQLSLTPEAVPLIYIGAYGSGALVLLAQSPFYPAYRCILSVKDLPRRAAQTGGTRLLQMLPTTLPPLLITALIPHSPHIAPGAAAGFAAAFKCISASRIFDRILSVLFLSSLPRLWRQDRRRAIRSVQMLYRFVTALSLVISSGVFLTAPFILRILLGQEFTKNSMTLSLLALFLGFSLLNTIVSYGLLSLGDPRRFFQSTFAPTLVTLPLILPLTWFFGEDGAAGAIIIVECAVFIRSVQLFSRWIPLRLREGMLLCAALIPILFDALSPASAGPKICATIMLILSGAAAGVFFINLNKESQQQ
ncbi:MAG: lipopolysaccharide biosynthesis protein [Fibrobacterota bacterium]